MRGRLIGWAAACSLAACARRADPPAVDVHPVAETASVPNANDAADDPAIWVHPSDPEQSVVIGTDKKGGIGVYDLSGRELQYLANGKQNNVDLRSGFPYGGRPRTLVASSDPGKEDIVLYLLDEERRQLEPIVDGRISTGIDPKGLCMYRSRIDGSFYVFVVGESDGDDDFGLVEQWRVQHTASGIKASLVRTFDVGEQSEGCAADDERGDLFVAEENLGLWRYSAEPGSGSARTLVAGVGEGEPLRNDVEGIAILGEPGGGGFLIVSCQSVDDFAVFRRGPQNDYLGRFEVVDGNGIDAVTHTDGIDVTGVPLGPRFPGGLFVAQDDHDDSGNQNFKLVPWQEIRAALVRPD